MENIVSHANKWRITQDLTAIYDPRKDNVSVKHAQKVMDMRQVICSVEDPLESMIFVDAIQRLGIDHLFNEEIEAILERQDMAIDFRNHEYKTLFEVSLCFRLLRQDGRHVPAEVFDAFKDKEGRFNEELRQDIRGLMELYEAAQLNLADEYNLNEAENFSLKHLNESLKDLDDKQARKVRNTLKHPYHKSLSKFIAQSFLKDFNGTYKWIQPLKELAKMEFMMAQSMHRQELSQISKWWEDLHLFEELKLARDQPLKWYTWTMGALPDPILSDLRIDLTKVISFIYIIDDIFDIYGTLDQLTLFTEAVNRWESAELDKLPKFMRMCFKALYDVTNEMHCKIQGKYGGNSSNFLRNTWASLCEAFLVEAKWFALKELPKADEYLNIAKVSSGMHVVLVYTFFLLGHGATKASGMCLKDVAQMITSVATILRLWDDLGSAKDENQDGHDGSYIDYYMQEQGVTEEVARQHVFNVISNEWEHLNKETLRLNKFSTNFSKISLNLARMVPLMYQYNDDQRLPLLEGYIMSLFNENIYH